MAGPGRLCRVNRAAGFRVNVCSHRTMIQLLRSGWLTRVSALRTPVRAPPGRSFAMRRRNRHGRGLRGELMLPTHPGYRTRSDRFDDLVLDSAQRLHDIWGKTLDGVRFAVDEIPPQLEQLVAEAGAAPMGSYTPATRRGRPGHHPVPPRCGAGLRQPRRAPGPGPRRRCGTHCRDAWAWRRKPWTRSTVAGTDYLHRSTGRPAAFSCRAVSIRVSIRA